MDNKQATCDARRIEQFLSDQLSDDEQSDFEDHLDACDTCRLELERRAAEPDIWQEIRESLSSRHVDGRAAGAGHVIGAGLPTPPDSATEGLSHVVGDLRSDEWCGRETAPQRATASQRQADSDAAQSGDGDAVRVDAVLQCLAPTDDPRMLGRFGGYEISGVVGYGGMGVVLKGFDAALNRYVAIKVLAPYLAVSGSARQRFAREAQAAAAVVHENVVAIHGVAEAGDLPYFVMPYVRGTSVQKRLNDHGPLGVTEILRIAMQTAAGLTAAHAQGLVHRDIKPANILLADGVERVKITDFGLARAVDDASLTRTGVIPGTPQFMSPEQARGESVDSRSDLFSLGSVMYAMCTGRPPFRAETSYGILRRITDTEPRPIREINSEIPDWLVTIINKLHTKDPAERFQSADQVAKLLEQCLAHVQQPMVVPLPHAAQLLADKAIQRASEDKSAFPEGLGRLGKAVLQPRVLIAGGIVAGILAVAAVVGMAIWPHARDESGRATNSPPPAAISVPLQSRSAGDVDSRTVVWHDGGTDQILELEHDIEGLEADAVRLWGDGASTSTSSASTNTNRLLDLEPSK